MGLADILCQRVILQLKPAHFPGIPHPRSRKGGVSFARSADQSVELTDAALSFLESAFLSADSDGDGLLNPAELGALFSTAPGLPTCDLGWPAAGLDEARANHSCITQRFAVLCHTHAAPLHALLATAQENGISLSSFLANWALSALLRPHATLENLLYLGFPKHPSEGLRMSPRRRRGGGGGSRGAVRRGRWRHGRNVLRCVVYGDAEAAGLMARARASLSGA